jgi:TolA-binding protein
MTATEKLLLAFCVGVFIGSARLAFGQSPPPNPCEASPDRAALCESQSLLTEANARVAISNGQITMLKKQIRELQSQVEKLTPKEVPEP